MAAPRGNQFWKARSSHGAKPKFDNPDDLWSACCEYFEWNEKNPLKEAKIVTAGGKARTMSVSKMRAMSIGALCRFIDIQVSTWYHWKEHRKDLSEIIACVEQIIYDQQFTGAAADLLNANIIARKLGLSDKQDHTSSDGSMTPTIITRRIVDPKRTDD